MDEYVDESGGDARLSYGSRLNRLLNLLLRRTSSVLMPSVSFATYYIHLLLEFKTS